MTNNHDAPLLSVIIPAKNAEKTLAETLDSVVGQDFFPAEIIVINDGSTDGTQKIIERYQEKTAQLVSITLSGKGLSAARNVGLQMASGTYGLFLDSDDYVDIFALERVLLAAHAAHIDIAMFNTHAFSNVFGRDEALTVEKQNLYRRDHVSASPVRSGGELAEFLIDQGSYLVSACLYLWRRDFVVTSRIRFDEGFLMEDNAFTFRLLQDARRAAFFAELVHFRRVADTSLSHRASLVPETAGYLRAWLSTLSSAHASSADAPPAWQAEIHKRLRRHVQKRAVGMTPAEFAELLMRVGEEP